MRRRSLTFAPLWLLASACGSPATNADEPAAATPAAGAGTPTPTPTSDPPPRVDEPPAPSAARAPNPSPIEAAPVWRTLATGDDHTCALVRAGDEPRNRVKCWGENGDGQLGLGDTKTRGRTRAEMGDALPFVRLPDDADLVAIDAVHRRSCALSRDGRLWCWGDNSMGELGLGDTRSRGSEPTDMAGLPPVELPGPITAFSMGESHTCAVLDDGAVHCWGDGSSGQLGRGDATRRGDDPGELGAAAHPVELGGGRRALGVAAGGSHTCVLMTDGDVKCFGEGRYGALGLSDTRSRGADARDMGDALPAVALGEFRAAEVGAGGLHSCARSTDSEIVCWGGNRAGQLGIGHSDSPGGKPGQSSTPPPGGDARPRVDLGTGARAVAIALGNATSCALLERGDGAATADTLVKCWGGRYGGAAPNEMGDHLESLDFGPDVVPIAIAPNAMHSCAIVVERVRAFGPTPPTTGHVKCWGVDVPGVGIGHGTGIPERARSETMHDATSMVDLGKDVRVVLPSR
jgi:hypothetical protein